MGVRYDENWWCGGTAGRARMAQEIEGHRSKERREVCEGEDKGEG